MGQKNISGGIFGRSAEISAKNRHLKFQNLRKFWKKKKNSIFFFRMWLQMPHDVSKKKKVSVVERVFKKLQKHFHQSWSTFHVKILVQRHYVFLTLEKNTKIFIFFSPPEKCEKMSKNKNFKKKINTFFFEKKYFFDFFGILIFSWKTDKLDQKTGTKCCKHVFTWY